MLQFRIRWSGYGAADDTWEVFADLNVPCGRAAWEYITENAVNIDLLSTTPRSAPPGPSGTASLPHAQPTQPAAANQQPGIAASSSQQDNPPGTSSQSDARAQRLAAREQRMGSASMNTQPDASDTASQQSDVPASNSQQNTLDEASSQSDARAQRLAAREQRMGSASADNSHSSRDLRGLLNMVLNDNAFADMRASL